MDVGEDTTLCDGDVSEELVQFLVVPDGELEMTWDDTGLLIVTGGISGQLEDFSSEVFQDSGEVDGSTYARSVLAWFGGVAILTGTNTLSIVALSQQTVNTTDWERETGL